MNKPWAKDYINLRYKFKSDPSAFEELALRYPKLSRKTVNGKFVCPTCPVITDKDGLIIGNEQKYLTDQNVLAECDCEEQWRLYYWYLYSNIEEDLQRMDWDEWESTDEESLAKTIKYLNHHRGFVDEGMGLVMCGTPGTGKTMLTTLVAKELVKLGYDVMFMLFEDLISAYTKGWKDLVAREKFENDIVRADILILDDVGKEISGTLSTGTFDVVLRNRNHANRPTFITSNLTATALENKYAGSIISLITGKNFLIETNGEDFRLTSRELRRQRVENGWRRPIV